MKKLGFENIAVEDVGAMIQAADENRNGQVEITEFETLAKKLNINNSERP